MHVMKVTLLYRELPKLVYTIVFCSWETASFPFSSQAFLRMQWPIVHTLQRHPCGVGTYYVSRRYLCYVERAVTALVTSDGRPRFFPDTQLNFPVYRRVTKAVSCSTGMDTWSRVKPVAHVSSAIIEVLNAWSFIFMSAVFHSVVLGNLFFLLCSLQWIFEPGLLCLVLQHAQ